MILYGDENVPHAVASFLRQCGHDVQLAGDYHKRGEPDHLIAISAAEKGAVVVTWGYHFRRFASSPRYPNLSVLWFHCLEEEGLGRVMACHDIIDFVFKRAGDVRENRVVIEIAKTPVVIVT
jgi:hypothetical protein